MSAERSAGYIHPDDRATAWEAVRRAIRDRQPYEWCLRMVRADGTGRIAHSRGQPFYDGNGKPIRMAGTIQDVTERKQAKEALCVANERLDLAMRGSNIGIWEADLPDGVIQHERTDRINLLEQFGYDPPEAPADHTETGPLIERLETMAQELIHQLDCLSLESLHRRAAKGEP